MALSALDDKKRQPNERDLAAVMGKVAACWRELRGRLEDDHGPLVEEWKFAGEKFGWSLRLKQPKRNLIYLTPGRGCFLAGLVLGEKAVSAARRAKLPPAVLRMIEEARPYAEGRGVRLEVRTRKDLATVLDLVAIKCGH